MAEPTQELTQDLYIPEATGEDRIWGKLLSLTPALCPSIDLSGKEPFLLGRSHQPSLTSVRQVSGSHCKIFVKNGDVVMVEDLSTNGTFIGRARIGKGAQLVLSNGSELHLTNPEHQTVPRCYFVFKWIGDERDLREIAFQAKYIIGEELGRGAFASVCKGRDLNGNSYAIRKLDKKKMERGTQSASGRNALEEEVKILQTFQRELKHPNIISVIEICDTDHYIYMVLELAGHELFAEINRHLFPEAKGRNFFQQMLSAVDYLHTQMKIVHRDLKPENILLAFDNPDVIKITDFGLSRAFDETSFMQSLCGTPLYIAPEILNNAQHQGYGRAVDLWSLGVILYVMLCGRTPFTATTPAAILAQVQSAKFDLECPEWRNLSLAARDLIGKLMEVDPAKRLTASAALQHPWITGAEFKQDSSSSSSSSSTSTSAAASSSSTSSSSSSTTTTTPPSASPAPMSAQHQPISISASPETSFADITKASDPFANAGHFESTRDVFQSMPSSSANAPSSSPTPSLSSSSSSSSMSSSGSGSTTTSTAQNGKSSASSSSSSSSSSLDESLSFSGLDLEEPTKKRMLAEDSDESDNDTKRHKTQAAAAKKAPTIECEHGQECFRMNPVHFEERSHPWWTDEEIKAKTSKKPSMTKQPSMIKAECKYGAECYSKNADHYRQFAHPWFTEAEIKKKCHSSK